MRLYSTMDRIGEYLVKHLIGEGGMGKVYEAEERLSKRRVALKVLKPELGKSEKGRELFLNEMTILAHFDHPNIVRCLSCSEIDGELVMALELLEGQTLRERLALEGPLSWMAAVAIVVQVAAALDVTHGQEPPIIHRDLKPENLMLIAGDQVKVMDFGIATAMYAMSKSTTHSVGTLQYMSPEQIDATTVDARSDLYALGLVFYEMLVGNPPFESDSPRELLNLQCTSEPPEIPSEVRSQLPKGVERLLFALLAKKPADRPENAAEVASALEPFSVAESPASKPSKATSLSVKATTASGTNSSKADSELIAKKVQARSDTIALLDRASAPRQIPTSWALGLVAIACLVAGAATYLVRGNTASDAPTIVPETSAKVEPAK
jgi:serine/threonine protein kinase